MDYSDVYTGADFTFNAIDHARPFHDTLKYAKQGTQMPQFPGFKTTVQTISVGNIDWTETDTQNQMHPPKRPVTGLLYPRGVFNK